MRSAGMRQLQSWFASFLAEASSILVATSLDFDSTLKALARLAVSRLADWCMIHALGADGELLHDVQQLLLNFGIYSKVYANRKEAGYKAMPDGRGGEAAWHERLTRCISPSALLGWSTTSTG